MRTRSGRKPSQNEAELRWLQWVFSIHGVRSYCEIGAREGDTFYEIASALGAGGRGLAVDLPGASWGKSGTGAALNAAVASLISEGVDASAIFGNSHDEATVSQVRSWGKFDALLIDADHAYDSVLADWENFRDCAGIVAFHDIAGAGLRDKRTGAAMGVPRLWAEIKASGRQTAEIIDTGSQFGIGIVWSGLD